jgi:hypothetical protein
LNESSSLNICLRQQSRNDVPAKNTKVAIITLHIEDSGEHKIDDIHLFTSFQKFIVGSYAEHHQYYFKVFEELSEEIKLQDIRWSKIWLLLNAMETWAKDFEYILWIGKYNVSFQSISHSL